VAVLWLEKQKKGKASFNEINAFLAKSAQAEVEAVAKADQKLRQKTRKRLLNCQGKEAEDDGNLNKSVGRTHQLH
jgi:hypothetical protein